MKYDEEVVDDLMRLVAAEVEISGGKALPLDERLLSWIGNDLRAGMTGDEKAKDEISASAFARRSLARIAARRAEKALPLRELRHRAAPVIATVSKAMLESSLQRCATMLDLSVAAGAGRELWEESCEQWLELPEDIAPSERYLALRVSGDSMSPILEPRDVILIKLDASPAIDDLVVASIQDQGYVVKRVASIRNGRLELSSFNSQYKSVFVVRHRSSILGTVIARFKHE
jgi:phage repressor protein C with HTH and peptisase S24 domain